MLRRSRAVQLGGVEAMLDTVSTSYLVAKSVAKRTYRRMRQLSQKTIIVKLMATDSLVFGNAVILLAEHEGHSRRLRRST